jgi:hypothetical protein
MLRKALVTRMAISLHPLHHHMCLVEQRLRLLQNAPFPVLPPEINLKLVKILEKIYLLEIARRF